MRSLSLKLVLAFALTSLVGMALAALFVRQFVVREFDAYLVTQQREALVEQLSDYYTQKGSWQGVGAALRLNNQPPGNGDPRRRFDMVLTNAQGRVVLSTDPVGRRRDLPPLYANEGTPILVNNEQVGTLYILGPLSERNPAEERYLNRTDQALAVAAAGAVLIALMLGLLLARLITRPVRDLTSAAKAIASGELGQQVPVRSRDELGLLAQQFNQMSSDLARSNELRRRMTADIAHDLRTPLTVISGYLEALRDESLRPTPARFATMHDETQVLLRLVGDLHTLSLADAGELPLKKQASAPQQLLERVAATYQHAAQQSGIALRVEAPASLPAIYVDVDQLIRALANLVSNALRHTPAGGTITLAASQAGGRVTLMVRDTGSGIAPEHLPNVFERFYRADAARHHASGGSGLGLAIVRSIVEAHGGKITVQSQPGQGTSFAISL
jgi:signal transduction histidine kinase